MASSIFAPGHEEIASSFSAPTTVSVLPISLYNFGMAFGPVLASPLSETFGRRAVYLIVLPLFSLFVLGTGFSQSMAAVIACRFFAGLFASPSVAIASATIADIFAPSDRALPMISYYSTPWLGSLMGPLVGGFVVEQKGWRWTQWTTLFFGLIFFFPIIFVQESYKKTIISRQAKKQGLHDPTKPQTTWRQQLRIFVRSNLGRPILMLLTEPIVTLLCLYMGFQFGLLYCFVIASPYVFSSIYDFGLGAQGLSFLGLIIGCLLGSVFLMVIEKKVYQPKLRHHKASIAATTTNANANANDVLEFPPENRLYGAMLGSICLPVGLFWFAWTSRPSIHWICPIVAQGVVMFGSLTVYVPCGMYMMDTYGALYGASASGANSLLRYTLAAIFPLFTLQMYQGIGIGWATSVLACCTLGMLPIPWAFFRWGPGLRRRSRYQRGD